MKKCMLAGAKTTEQIDCSVETARLSDKSDNLASQFKSMGFAADFFYQGRRCAVVRWCRACRRTHCC